MPQDHLAMLDALRYGDGELSICRVDRVVKTRYGTLLHDAEEGGSETRDDLWDAGGEGVLGVGHNKKVFLAGQLIKPDVAPVELHELVVAGHYYDFGDLCEGL